MMVLSSRHFGVYLEIFHAFYVILYKILLFYLNIKLFIEINYNYWLSFISRTNNGTNGLTKSTATYAGSCSSASRTSDATICQRKWYLDTPGVVSSTIPTTTCRTRALTCAICKFFMIYFYILFHICNF